MATSGTSSVDEWMNGCQFECKICCLKFGCLSDIRNHVSSFHHTTLEAYESVHGSAIVKLTNLVCFICQAEVPHDPEFVTNHLRVNHQITPNEYRRLYDPQAGSASLKFNWDQNTLDCPSVGSINGIGTVAVAAGPSSAAVGPALNGVGLEPQDLVGWDVSPPDLPDDLFLDDVDAFIARQSQPVKNEMIQWEPL